MSEDMEFKIVFLSDPKSWINSYLEILITELKELGNEVLWFHDDHELPAADFCFCLSFSKILHKDILDLFRHTLVVHASDLPSGKGWSPLTWKILEGQNRITVSLLEASVAVDSGPIYAQRHIDFEGYELIDAMRARLSDATYELCSWFILQYPMSASRPRIQKGVESFYPRRTLEDSRLDVSKTIAEQFDLLRVVDNKFYPAFFEWKGRRFVLKIEDDGPVQ